MGWRFRKTFKIFKGVRINLSKSGISTSVGKKGATVNVNKKGAKATVGLPGSGVSYSTKRAGCGLTVLMLAFVAMIMGAWAQEAAPSPLMTVLQEEMARSFKGFQEKGHPPPYFISYFVTETQEIRLEASMGAIRRQTHARRRTLDVEVRVGNRSLDNTHSRGGRAVAEHVALPADDDPAAWRDLIWLATDRRYHQAVKDLNTVKANLTIEKDDANTHAPFSQESPQRYFETAADATLDEAAWEPRLRAWSAYFNDFPSIYMSSVTLEAQATNKYLVTSEGAAIQLGSQHYRLSMLGQTRADDGMSLSQFHAFDASNEAGLAADAGVRAMLARTCSDLLSLRRAPVLDAYSGPALLSGEAAAVFFHENLGHRVEGLLQDDPKQGQTFSNMVNRPILPRFISVYDDPTRASLDVDLNGFYRYDDEGVKAQRVAVVDHGVLKHFLLSRSPVAGFPQSNGHGRKASGFSAVARQGNLVVESSQTVAEDKLRDLLIAECKKMGKSFGLRIDQVSGGSTYTGGGMPQIFQVHPTLVYRVYVDGRPDQLVRGVELIGTPLASFLNIKCCGDREHVFNGYCGARSGMVPVAAVAPATLTTQIETQKQTWHAGGPPLLPDPLGGSIEK